MAIRTTILSLFIIVSTLPSLAFGQSYSVIDGDLGIYCADLPDGTNSLVNVTSNRGLYVTNTLDPEAEKAKIIKLRKNIQKRINALNQIKSDYDPEADGAKLRQVYKFVANEIINDLDNDDSLDNLAPTKIYRKIGALIRQLKDRLAELQTAIETIDRCIRNEDLIPPPDSVSSEVIYFPFTHPDYGTTEWMRGLGVTGILHKKRSTGVVCVSASKSNGNISVFPKESALSLWRNPCIMFWQTAFRRYPFCHYGTHQHSAVGWFGITSAGFSQREVDDREKASLERQLSSYGKISVRAPTKKKPCRTR